MLGFFLPRSAMLERESARRTLVMRQTISFTVKKASKHVGDISVHVVSVCDAS